MCPSQCLWGPLLWIICHSLVPPPPPPPPQYNIIVPPKICIVPFLPWTLYIPCLYKTEHMSVFWKAVVEWFLPLIQKSAVHLFCSWFTQVPIFPWISLECHTGSTGCAYLKMQKQLLGNKSTPLLWAASVHHGRMWPWCYKVTLLACDRWEYCKSVGMAQASITSDGPLASWFTPQRKIGRSGKGQSQLLHHRLPHQRQPRAHAAFCVCCVNAIHPFIQRVDCALNSLWITAALKCFDPSVYF